MWQSIKRRIFAGLLAIVPIAVTFWILKLLFTFFDGFAAPILKRIGIEIPGLGIILTLVIVFVLGLFIVGYDQGHIFSLVQGEHAFVEQFLHELTHDMRHAAGFPCH